MRSLNDDLELLYEFNDLRDRAKSLRKRGLAALKGIEEITPNGVVKPRRAADQGVNSYGKWIASGNEVEAALLVKIQNHRDINEDDQTNEEAEASVKLKDVLRNISLSSLLPILYKNEYRTLNGDDLNGQVLDVGSEQRSAVIPVAATDENVPVLVAARAMQSLVMRSETVFSSATMLCYYCIVSELYTASDPDWTIGAARANVGGDASAFITGECIRAVLSFENAIIRTVEFFRATLELWEKYIDLSAMLEGVGVEPHTADNPISVWADMAIERTWLDWYVSTNRRRGEIAIDKILSDLPEQFNMQTVGHFLGELPKRLKSSIETAKDEMKVAEKKIDEIRKKQKPYQDDDPGKIKEGFSNEDVRIFQQTQSAHELGLRAVTRGIRETDDSEKFLESGDFGKTLGKFIIQFENISHSIHRILEPAKQHVKTIVDRELANVPGRFDAGELAFAAASFGATTSWKSNDRLQRACSLLIENLPDSGNLLTRTPIHATHKGYRLLPIGCEMTRSFAQLLQKTSFEFEPPMARKMLNVFEEKLIHLQSSESGKRSIGWNFEGAPNSDSPSVWVSAVAVLALDRIIRMLNERINTIVLRHFEVIRPERPNTNMTLKDLIYSDYGFSAYYPNDSGRSMAIRLEQMRAHIMRAQLPKAYKTVKGEKEKVYAAILYGPPGTGKTTFAEALALSSNVSLIRVSPSDLTVQGQELIEGRARAVFEALSMLTQAVIILDEFDPVLAKRDSKEKGAVSSDRAFNFLLTGMLPKLVKLNAAAKRQSLVYCLATNFINNIDEAATRPGRFELHIPIYQPDVLSRAGSFLYRLIRFQRKNPEAFLQQVDMNSEQLDVISERLMQVLKKTAKRPASELANDYFVQSGFEFYLTGKNEQDWKHTKTKPLPTQGNFSQVEKDERTWINNWEEHLEKARLKDLRHILKSCLTPPS